MVNSLSLKVHFALCKSLQTSLHWHTIPGFRIFQALFDHKRGVTKGILGREIEFGVP